MELAAEEQAVETEKTTEERVKELEEIVLFLKEENLKEKDKAKSAFAARDKVKEELRKVKNSDTDVNSIISRLEEQVAEKDKILKEFSERKVNEEKMAMVKKVATEAGLKDHYMGMLDRFLTLDEVIIDKPITVKLQIEQMKTNYPDLFGRSGRELEQALPAPKLMSGSTLTKEQIAKEYKKEVSKGQDCDLARAIELRQLLDE
jgi:hypothetical protein